MKRDPVGYQVRLMYQLPVCGSSNQAISYACLWNIIIVIIIKGSVAKDLIIIVTTVLLLS